MQEASASVGSFPVCSCFNRFFLQFSTHKFLPPAPSVAGPPSLIWNGSREWRKKMLLHCYCTKLGQFSAICPFMSPTPNASSSSLVSQTKLPGKYEKPLTKVMFQSSLDCLVLQALVDSRADTNLMDLRVKKRLQSSRLSQPLCTWALDGRLMCKVTH